MKARNYMKDIETLINEEVDNRTNEIKTINSNLIKENERLLKQISRLNEKLNQK